MAKEHFNKKVWPWLIIQSLFNFLIKKEMWKREESSSRKIQFI